MNRSAIKKMGRFVNLVFYASIYELPVDRSCGSQKEAANSNVSYHINNRYAWAGINHTL